MFGQGDHSNQQQDTNQIPDQTIDAALSDEASQPASPTISPSDPAGVQLPAPVDQSWQHPGAPISDGDAPAPSGQPDPAPVVSPATTPSDPAAANDLIDIKQKALSQLSPLVGHLDQAPEEKFRTTMMMIQASDDQSLISTAFEAAQGITDEKARAQALLDIVNEINYFTQQHES